MKLIFFIPNSLNFVRFIIDFFYEIESLKLKDNLIFLLLKFKF